LLDLLTILDCQFISCKRELIISSQDLLATSASSNKSTSTQIFWPAISTILFLLMIGLLFSSAKLPNIWKKFK
jgi:hypothetical protein